MTGDFANGMPIAKASRMFFFETLNSRDTAHLVANGAAAAFLVGLTGSIHCAVMCGPLACAGLKRTPDAAPVSRLKSALAWNSGRVISYAAVGALLGSIGWVATSWTREAHKILPWVMVLGLVLSAIDLGRWLPPSSAVMRLGQRAFRWVAPWSPLTRSFAMGAFTPLLPCGLLYGMFLAAASAGSAGGGALLAASFALGAVPALAAVQLQGAFVKVPPRVAAVLRVAVPLTAALVVAVRTWQGEAACCH